MGVAFPSHPIPYFENIEDTYFEIYWPPVFLI